VQASELQVAFSAFVRAYRVAAQRVALHRPSQRSQRVTLRLFRKKALFWSPLGFGSPCSACWYPFGVSLVLVWGGGCIRFIAVTCALLFSVVVKVLVEK